MLRINNSYLCIESKTSILPIVNEMTKDDIIALKQAVQAGRIQPSIIEMERMLGEWEASRATPTLPPGVNDKLLASELYYLLGCARRKQGRFDLAICAFLEASRLDPDSPATHAMSMLDSIMNYYHKDYYNP